MQRLAAEVKVSLSLSLSGWPELGKRAQEWWAGAQPDTAAEWWRPSVAPAHAERHRSGPLIDRYKSICVGTHDGPEWASDRANASP